MATSTEDGRVPIPEKQIGAENLTTSQAEPPASDHAASTKPINALVVDTGPIIQNDPTVSTLLAQAEQLYTIPSVISEIRDEATRMRAEITLLPFLKLRNPKPESIKFITDFARRTGDLEVLSRPDLHLLALAYELELECNGGDWRLRKTPTQKGINGKSPAAAAAAAAAELETNNKTIGGNEKEGAGGCETNEETTPILAEKESVPPEATTEAQLPLTLEEKIGSLTLESAVKGDLIETKAEGAADTKEEANEEEDVEEEEEAGDDDDGDGEWITPSNLKKHQAKEKSGGLPEQPIQKRLQAALLTSDFAMQNVALRVNLNLLSPALARITQVKTWVLRCHGCFAVTRQMTKQFCPSCGQATLTRTSCSTDQSGNFRLHLKRNYQFNKRGNVYSVPKPVHGSASGKLTDRSGGGKNGWGRELILSEDQPEYTKKVDEQRRTRVRDMMDEDYLPNLLTGVRSGGGGRPRVGAGRNVNAKKRR